MSRTRAHAKLNLSLVVGPTRADGLHEVATAMQELDLHDDVELEPWDGLAVEGFDDDTLVRAALETLAERAGVVPAWRALIEKRIPVASGLGGGSSDAATALRLANEGLATPLTDEDLHVLAAVLGADVPFFLRGGSQLATGSGSELTPLELPTAYIAVVLLPTGAHKESTAEVYAAFDERGAAEGFEARRTQLRSTLAEVAMPRDLARLPGNDLASSPLADELCALGAFRADVTGAGPAVYGLFDDEPAARRAASELADAGRSWLTRPVRRAR